MRYYWYRFNEGSTGIVGEDERGQVYRFGTDERWDNREHFNEDFGGRWLSEIAPLP